jgi:hypothetical protein
MRARPGRWQLVADGFGLRVLEFRPPFLGAGSGNRDERVVAESDSGVTVGKRRRCGAFKFPGFAKFPQLLLFGERWRGDVRHTFYHFPRSRNLPRGAT